MKRFMHEFKKNISWNIYIAGVSPISLSVFSLSIFLISFSSVSRALSPQLLYLSLSPASLSLFLSYSRTHCHSLKSGIASVTLPSISQQP